MGKFDCSYCKKSIDGKAIIDGSKVFHVNCESKYKVDQREKELKKKYPDVPYHIVDSLERDNREYALDSNWCVVVEPSSDCGFEAEGFETKEQAIDDIKECVRDPSVYWFHSLYKKGKPVKVEIKTIVEVMIDES